MSMSISNREIHEFKYTISKERQIWSKNVYSLRKHLLHILPNIPWKDYEYNGPTYIVKDVVYETEDEILPEIKENFVSHVSDVGGIGYIKIANDISFNVNPNLDYTIFGGSAYELLNDAYPNVELHNYVDPTGDLDIKVNYYLDKKVIYNMNQDYKNVTDTVYLNNFNYRINDGINPFYKDMMYWIFTQICHQLEKNSDSLLSKLLTSNVKPFSIESYLPKANSDSLFLQEKYGFFHKSFLEGRLHVIAFTEFNKDSKEVDKEMMKIQIVINVESESYSIQDHIFEIILIANQLEMTKTPKMEIQSKNKSYFIDTISDLLTSNIQAYNIRSEYIHFNEKNEEYFHKGMNHITRFLYLLELLKHNHFKIENVDINKIKYLFKLIENGLKKSKECFFRFYKRIDENTMKEFHIPIESIVIGYIDVFMRYNSIPNINMSFQNLNKSFSCNLPKIDVNNYPKNKFIINKEYYEIQEILFLNKKRAKTRKTYKRSFHSAPKKRTLSKKNRKSTLKSKGK